MKIAAVTFDYTRVQKLHKDRKLYKISAANVEIVQKACYYVFKAPEKGHKLRPRLAVTIAYIYQSKQSQGGFLNQKKLSPLKTPAPKE
ncbi:MAG: hypothetical protein F6J93_38315 [Oscillatoria sp. SIO1A7]|nr:hypothetical protein [Oscillatoria sp. SIO1A7]